MIVIAPEKFQTCALQKREANFRAALRISVRQRRSLHPRNDILMWEGFMKLLRGVLLGVGLVAAGQARAEEDTSSELRALKARLKQLEQRIDSQGRREEVKAVKAAPSVFDPCPAGKVCVKGVTLTFGGWIDLTGIYRSRNLASDTGSIYNFIPFPQARNYNTGE
jgi:outer membrane murein-binding lipoprotein Lpp